MQKTYEKLIVWQKSMDLVEAIYRLTEDFPRNETYNLTSQMRRATVSIPSNIAEGSRRNGKKEFKHFLAIAYGSGAELETQIMIAKRLNFVNLADYERVEVILDEIMRMLNKLLRPTN